MLSFSYLYPVPVTSNCRKAITAKPWDEAHLTQINYLKNVRGTKLTCAINRLKTQHTSRPGQGQIQTKYRRFQKLHLAHTRQSVVVEGLLSTNETF